MRRIFSVGTPSFALIFSTKVSPRSTSRVIVLDEIVFTNICIAARIFCLQPRGQNIPQNRGGDLRIETDVSPQLQRPTSRGDDDGKDGPGATVEGGGEEEGKERVVSPSFPQCAGSRVGELD